MTEEIEEIVDIDIFIHCAMCIEEVRTGNAGTISPAKYSRLVAGVTMEGQFVLACERHGAVVCDFPAPQPLLEVLRGGHPDVKKPNLS